MWNGSFFETSSLQKLGHVVQLGHDSCDCDAPVHRTLDFEVLDLSGQHTITIVFFGCPGAPALRTQLLHASWFPATPDRPHTAFTFDVLNTFQLLNLQGKISTYDFYYSLVHKTDNLRISERLYTQGTRWKTRSEGIGVRVSCCILLWCSLSNILCHYRTAMINSYLLHISGGTSRCLNVLVMAMTPWALNAQWTVNAPWNALPALIPGRIFRVAGKMHCHLFGK